MTANSQITAIQDQPAALGAGNRTERVAAQYGI